VQQEMSFLLMGFSEWQPQQAGEKALMR